MEYRFKPSTRIYLERRPVEWILIEGEPVSRLCVAITGRAHVDKQGQRIGTLEPGHIVGSALAPTGLVSRDLAGKRERLLS